MEGDGEDEVLVGDPIKRVDLDGEAPVGGLIVRADAC